MNDQQNTSTAEIVRILDSARDVQRNPRPEFTLFRDIDPAPRKRWLIKDVLGAGELSVFYGAPGCGKSAAMADAACSVAAGRDWFGKPVNSCTVVYVAAERSALVERRMAAWRKHHLITDIPLAVVPGFWDLCTRPDDTNRLISLIRKICGKTQAPVGWVIIDTVAQVLAGGDENSGKDMGALCANAARLQIDIGAHVTLVHHVPHGEQQRMRGHGALLGAADSTFRVEHDKENKVRRITVEKANDAPDNTLFGFNFESVTLSVDPEDGSETTAPIVVPVDMPDTSRTEHVVRLSDAEKLAKRALEQCVSDFGQELPPSYNLPRSIRAVSVKEWRAACYQSQIADGGDDARQKAFKRASDKLIAKNQVCVRNEWAWLL